MPVAPCGPQGRLPQPSHVKPLYQHFTNFVQSKKIDLIPFCRVVTPAESEKSLPRAQKTAAVSCSCEPIGLSGFSTNQPRMGKKKACSDASVGVCCWLVWFFAGLGLLIAGVVFLGKIPFNARSDEISLFQAALTRWTPTVRSAFLARSLNLSIAGMTVPLNAYYGLGASTATERSRWRLGQGFRYIPPMPALSGAPRRPSP